ncbi:SGNH/GDSL hydrolase family protein, partial [Ruminococcaceae bacterium OttesenSCG-928-O06]|nr:SGNH/GDSL hydrolase family protein [Ruminococcaceae bacterium OttesenSCG-928-O06]
MPHEDPQKHSAPKPHRARAGQGAGTPAQSPAAAPAQGAAGTPPGTPGGKSTKTVYTARPGAAAKKAGKKPFRPRKVDIAIAATALVGVAVLVVFFVGFLPTLSAQGASSLASSSQSASFSYASSLAPEKFVGTILPETEDAGMEYSEETLFLGDSNTLRMLYYADVTGVTMANGIGVESMGITTFSTQRCAQFSGVGQVTMPQAVGILQPRRVVLTFGTNNVGMEIDKFIEYYRDAIDAVKDAYAYTDIILGAIFPVDQYRQNEAITMRRIDQMNAALATLAKEEDCKFLNWSEALLDEEIGYCGFEHTIQDG